MAILLSHLQRIKEHLFNMGNKYQNKYRISSVRLKNWDYSSSAAYFVTICTKNRFHFFGEVINGEMILNDLGQIVENEWVKTIEMRPDMNLELGEFVVMPNHFHGILIIGDNEYNTNTDNHGADDIGADYNGRDAMHGVSTGKTMGKTMDIYKNQFGIQSKNLASIIRGFKSAVTTYARKNNNLDFGWQARYHDHIIRNELSFERIQNYIINNPSKWNEDKFY